MPGISVREFARRDGCDEALVRRAIKSGRLRRSPEGLLDEALVGTGWRHTNRLREVLARPRDPNEKVPGLYESKAVRAFYEARLLELRYEEMAGSLAPVDAVMAKFEEMNDKIRARVMMIAPAAAAELNTCRSSAMAEGILRKHVISALKELSEGAVSA